MVPLRVATLCLLATKDAELGELSRPRPTPPLCRPKKERFSPSAEVPAVQGSGTRREDVFGGVRFGGGASQGSSQTDPKTMPVLEESGFVGLFSRKGLRGLSNDFDGFRVGLVSLFFLGFTRCCLKGDPKVWSSDRSGDWRKEGPLCCPPQTCYGR